MIICINCSPETKTKMDSLLKHSQYKDYSELVGVAIDNLSVLENEVVKNGTLVIGEELVTDNVKPSRKTMTPNSRGTATSSARQAKAGRAKAPEPARIPELFQGNGLEDLSVTTVEIPFIEQHEDIFTLDRWLFGQYNKLLPAKANCRALLRMMAEHSGPAPLDEIAPRIGEAAALLGDYLAEHDRRHQIGRDDSLATAFPRSGPDGEKGRARYANQFVGSLNSQGVLSSLLWDYRLAVIVPGELFEAPDRRARWDYRLAAPTSGERARLALTEPGVHFARMSNAILDACQTDAAHKFSPEEISFLLEHIRARVPVEAFAFQTLIKAIADGADTPDRLGEALQMFVPTDTNRSLSPSFLMSQRSGALSRMSDLGLVIRKRDGVRVSYIVTTEGSNFRNNRIIETIEQKKESD